MTPSQTVAALGAAMMLSAAAAEAADGILIAQKMHQRDRHGHDAVRSRSRRRACAPRATDARGRKQTMIFDGTAQVMRTIDDEAKTYTEMTKADVERLARQMAGAMAQMQEQMKNMPPEARTHMEAMMQGRGMPAAPRAPTEYKKVGTDKVGKWTCDKYEGTRGGEKISELCTVSPATLGFTRRRLRGHQADGGVLRRSWCRRAPTRCSAIGSAETPNGFSGLPVRTVIFRNGAPSARRRSPTPAGRTSPTRCSRCRPAIRSAT